MSQNPNDWTIQPWPDGLVYPFVEDEDGNITGLGHADKAIFAGLVNRYDDEECGTEPPPFEADDICHQWVTAEGDGSGDGDVLHPCDSNTPGAFPVTTLWGAR